MKQTYAVDIVDFIRNIDETCSVHIEDCPAYPFIHRDLEELEIDNGICYDAEKWHRNRWRERLSPMKYIAYWEHVRPPRIDEIEEYTFDFSKYKF